MFNFDGEVTVRVWHHWLVAGYVILLATRFDRTWRRLEKLERKIELIGPRFGIADLTFTDF